MAKEPITPSGDADKVGYRNPPKASQFKPGRSGNPSGRPKGSRDWAVLVDEEMQQLVTLTENGRQKRLTRQRVLVKKLFARAFDGDHKALQLIIEMTSKAANDNQNPFEGLPISALAEFLARSLNKKEGGSD